MGPLGPGFLVGASYLLFVHVEVTNQRMGDVNARNSQEEIRLLIVSHLFEVVRVSSGEVSETEQGQEAAPSEISPGVLALESDVYPLLRKQSFRQLLVLAH